MNSEQNHRVLIIGHHPTPDDLEFTLNQEKNMVDLNSGLKAIKDRGYEVDLLEYPIDESAVLKIEHYLKTHDEYGCIVISITPTNTVLLEKLVNAVHLNAHKSYIGISVPPEEASKAIDRWIHR